MLQLSPGKTPARGQARDGGNKGGPGRMQSWKNPSGRRRGGGAPGSRSTSPAVRAGPLPARATASTGRPRAREKCGEDLWSPESPGTEGSRSCARLVHAAPRARPPGGWAKPQPRVAAVTWEGARTDPHPGATRPHTRQCAHDHLHARAPRHASLQLTG